MSGLSQGVGAVQGRPRDGGEGGPSKASGSKTSRPDASVYGNMLSAFTSSYAAPEPPRKKRRRSSSSPPPASLPPGWSGSAQSPPTPLKIKVLGERNTGTNYLSLLLTSNSYPSLLSPHYTLGWKHSAPSSSSSDVVYLCCVRPASDWLASTHARPYHMEPRPTFPDFLSSNVSALEPRADHPCHSDPSVPPLELYRRKCLAFERFMEGEGVRGAIVPLPWLQRNAAGFLKELR
eukprot:CAMPEP_0182468242 /NCGR_PEP_ID=MMETSP1319-20130603/15178_1 /TAXON_ID=172717 /ORGANISM="Bolidomonas pacifica, Strain RCC208" /LENGTH=233 /DNA_ID=CAMNT_0024668417 /DNA_START=90 /DNA_END=788 /DNA_ORIENTATION=-